MQPDWTVRNTMIDTKITDIDNIDIQDNVLKNRLNANKTQNKITDD